MNIELDELQKIAQQLDYFMRDYGNSKALEVAAEAIAEEFTQFSAGVLGAYRSQS